MELVCTWLVKLNKCSKLIMWVWLVIKRTRVIWGASPMESSDGEPLSPLRGLADPLDLTGFIFGNLDEKGNLDSDSIYVSILYCTR